MEHGTSRVRNNFCSNDPARENGQGKATPLQDRSEAKWSQITITAGCFAARTGFHLFAIRNNLGEQNKTLQPIYSRREALVGSPPPELPRRRLNRPPRKENGTFGLKRNPDSLLLIFLISVADWSVLSDGGYFRSVFRTALCAENSTGGIL